MRHAPAADHVLKALVRRELTDRFGVEFARSSRTGAWEVAAIEDSTLRAFSKRGASIEALLVDLGFDPALATRRAQDLAAAQSRQGKTHATGEDDATLQGRWQSEARERGIDSQALAATALPDPDGTHAAVRCEVAEGPTAKAVRWEAVQRQLLEAEDGLTAHQRRFTRVDVLAAVADALPDGAADVAEIEQLADRVLAHSQVVALGAGGLQQPGGPAPGPVQAGVVEVGVVPDGPGRQLAARHMANAARFTTADVVEVERVVLAVAAASRDGQGYAAAPQATVELARASVEVGLGFALSDEQGRALERLVTSDRAVDAVLGAPGTGKTTLLRAARVAWEAEGLTVAGAATAAVAAQQLESESGIASSTVAQWLYRAEVGQGLSGVDVLVLDEANLTDDRARARLLAEAARTGTKLVEVGDPRQLRGVGVGSLFGRVHELVGGPVLEHNRRQADEDERRAIAAWRAGGHAEALDSWAGRGRLVATDTGEQALTAMVGRWMRERAGAPDAHAELSGVVMLAGTNELVDRLNDAAQAVRAAGGETGAQRSFAVRGGRTVRLRVGDHVMVRLNDRRERGDGGPDVLSGHRGVVEALNRDGSLRVGWREQGPDGPQLQSADLSAEFIGAGGLSLGYALTVHKAEGLTVAADWTMPDGGHQGGTVLVHAPGLDKAGLHVASSRHKDRVWLFAGLEQVESVQQRYERGRPVDEAARTGRVVAGLAETARSGRGRDNDVPVSDELPWPAPSRPAPSRPAPADEPAEASRPALPVGAGREQAAELARRSQGLAGRAAARRAQPGAGQADLDAPRPPAPPSPGPRPEHRGPRL